MINSVGYKVNGKVDEEVRNQLRLHFFNKLYDMNSICDAIENRVNRNINRGILRTLENILKLRFKRRTYNHERIKFTTHKSSEVTNKQLEKMYYKL